MRLLLLIILFIILFPIVKTWLLMRRARRNMEEAFKQVRNREAATYGEPERGYNYPTGEYADFEDVAGGSPAADSAHSYAGESTVVEEQIVDAEFEDLEDNAH